MQYKITPIKAKINDSNLSDFLDITINNDNGVKCNFFYNLSYINTAAHRNEITLTGSIGITEIDYNNYKIASDRLKFAADYVATHVNPNLTILS